MYSQNVQINGMEIEICSLKLRTRNVATHTTENCKQSQENLHSNRTHNCLDIPPFLSLVRMQELHRPSRVIHEGALYSSILCCRDVQMASGGPLN